MKFIDRVKIWIKPAAPVPTSGNDLPPGIPNRSIPTSFRPPRWLPWAIAGLTVLYLVTAVAVGSVLLRGDDSPRIRALARWLPIPVARVDGQLIWARDYLDYRTFIETFVARSNEAGQAIDTTAPIGQQVINLLVSSTTIERAARADGISVTSAEVQGAFDDILVAQSGQEPREVTEDELNTILHELYGSSKERLYDLIRIRLYEDKVKSELLEQARFRHILVQDEGKAKDLIDQLKGGADFSQLAKDHSEHLESRDNGGDVGFVTRGQQLEPIEQAIFTNDIRLLEEPIKTDFGYHVVEILEKKGRVQQSFDAWLADAEQRLHSTVYLSIPVSTQ